MDVGNALMAQLGRGLQGCRLAMFVCEAVRFHTDRGLVRASLHSPCDRAPDVPAPSSRWRPRTNIIHARSKQSLTLINNKAGSGRHCPVTHSQHVNTKGSEGERSRCKEAKCIRMAYFRLYLLFNGKQSETYINHCYYSMRDCGGKTMCLEVSKIEILILSLTLNCIKIFVDLRMVERQY